MVTFILLGVFFLISIMFAAIAYTANNRRRAGMSGTDPSQNVPSDVQQGRPATHRS